MRPAIRLLTPAHHLRIDTLAHAQPRYICRSCRRRALPLYSGRTAAFSTSSTFWEDNAAPTKQAHKPTSVGIAASQSAAELRQTSGSVSEEPRQQYVPATTWDGLDWVATPQWFDALCRPKRKFQKFMPLNALTDRQRIKDELLMSIVEVFSLKEAGIDLKSLDRIRPTRQWPEGVQLGLDKEAQNVIVRFPSDIVKSAFFNTSSMTKEQNTPQGLEGKDDTVEIGDHRLNSHSTTERKEKTHPNDEMQTKVRNLDNDPETNWNLIRLDDIDIRFALVKRAMRRTGIRLNDPDIATSDTAGALFARLSRLDTPKKLGERLMSDETLLHLPNVKITPRRIKAIDKEKEVGRWKVIKRELMDRGLPVN